MNDLNDLVIASLLLAAVIGSFYIGQKLRHYVDSRKRYAHAAQAFTAAQYQRLDAHLGIMAAEQARGGDTAALWQTLNAESERLDALLEPRLY